MFTSDLVRALKMLELAFGESTLPVLHDWRLRECDYGELTRHPTQTVHGHRADYLDQPYPALLKPCPDGSRLLRSKYPQDIFVGRSQRAYRLVSGQLVIQERAIDVEEDHVHLAANPEL